jgi:steroid delta-isomerase-like uncharacterized protein
MTADPFASVRALRVVTERHDANPTWPRPEERPMALRFDIAALSLLLAACAGKEEVIAPPPPPPAPPTVASTAPTPTTTPPAAQPTPAKPAIGELEKKTLTDWYAAFNAHDASKLIALCSPDAVFVRLGPGGWSETGTWGITEAYAPLFAAMPDITAAPVRVLQKDDLLVVEWAVVGTNTGPFEGAKPTNKKVGIRGVTVYWFRPDGLIRRIETVRDDTTVAEQLGKVPGKPREVALLPAKEPVWMTATDTEDEYKLVDQMMATWPAAWNKHDEKAYASVLTDDTLHSDLAGPMDYKGKIANMKELAADMKAFPDMKVTIERAWAFSPNIVVSEFTFSGTMKGNYGALRATRKPVVVHGLEVDELKDGKLLKGYNYENGTELLDQLGLLPKEKAAPPAKTK